MENNIGKIVALYRLSKERITKDGRIVQKGYSIEAQQEVVNRFSDERGGEIVHEFTEIISGRKKDRPILQEALAYCKKYGYTLVIARLDRLSRRVALISALLESDIKFRVVQYPDIDPKENEFFFQVLAAVSQLEVKYIRERTRAALQVKKSKGEPLGVYGREILSKLNKEKSRLFALSLYPLIKRLWEKDIRTIRGMAKYLNRRKVATYCGDGHKWHPATVHKVLRILKECYPFPELKAQAFHPQ